MKAADTKLSCRPDLSRELVRPRLPIAFVLWGSKSQSTYPFGRRCKDTNFNNTAIVLNRILTYVNTAGIDTQAFTKC